MKCEVTILSDEGGTSKSPPIWVTADTGAQVTCLPASQLAAHGVAKAHSMRFTDAGGQHTIRSTGYAWIEVAGRRCRTLVQFNTDRDALLLSVEAMAAMRIAPDPSTKQWISTANPKNLVYISGTPARTNGFLQAIRRISDIFRSNT